MATCGTKPLRARFLASSFVAAPGAVGDPGPPMDSRGEKTELPTTPAVGVAVPEVPGVGPANELVDAKRLDKEAFERR